MLPDAWYDPVPVTAPSAYLDASNNSNTSFYDPPIATPGSSKFAHMHGLNPSSSAGGSTTYLGARLGNTSRPGSSFIDDASSSVRGRVGYDSFSHPVSTSQPQILMAESKIFTSENQARRPPGVSADWTIEPSIVIQHEDAGAIQEIPPPYRAPDQNSRPSNSVLPRTEVG